MAALKQDGTCFLDLRDYGLRKRWPCYGRIGQFCLTPPPTLGDSKRPDLKAKWFSVSHQPTGMKVCAIHVDDSAAMLKLEKWAKLFGRARTLRGVMRKYKALSVAQKLWIEQQQGVSILPEKKKGKR